MDELLSRESPAVVSLSFAATDRPVRGAQAQLPEGGRAAHARRCVSDLSRALRDEERRAWQRLIRVIGHEINNSLTPIKSLAGTLQGHARRNRAPQESGATCCEGLRLIGDRADSLSKFVATYSQLARIATADDKRLSR